MKITRSNWFVPLALTFSLLRGAASGQAQALGQTNALEVEEPAAIQVAATNSRPVASIRGGTIRRGPIVVFGRNVELPAGESAEAVVVIGGSAKVHGRVRDAVVAIGGDVETDGQVGDAAVAVLGSVTVGQGADVHGDVVAVGGKIAVAEDAVVGGNAVAVGGTVDLAKGATVKGQVQEVDIGIPGFPGVEGLGKWVRYCVLELRPLAPQVRWVWIAAGVFFLLYLLVALAFPRPVQACVNELTERPASTFLVGLLAKLLVPVVVLLLTLTGVGLLVVPFLCAALFFAAIVGKVALLEYLGGALGRPFNVQLEQKPLIAFLLGTILITLLYIVPVLGFVSFGVSGLWGFGAVITASLRRLRHETQRRPSPPSAGNPPPAASFAPVPPFADSQGGAGEGPLPAAAPSGARSEPSVKSGPEVPGPLAYPRAGFWERMGAGFLDFVLVSILAAVVGGGLPFALVIALAYFAGMWTWRGATIGGVVLKLKVVRSDGGPVTFLVALVRGLMAAFSIVMLFLGFLWIAWDKDKQGWHDKIAGTDVVSLPRSMPLVCL